MNKTNNIILITGAAGFIGMHISKKLLQGGFRVIGLDNLNAYYDVSLKHDRINSLSKYPNFNFAKGDLLDCTFIKQIFDEFSPNIILHLAAQAGVRYSIDNPRTYIDSNIVGFFNILESCRRNGVGNLIFASSSSVYGNRDNVPFRVSDCTDYPVSLYAATKKSNELMAYTYSHLYDIQTVGLRFFTVYGPWGRPDMAYFKFADRIMKNEPIQLFNYGKMLRDFTYIDDIVDGIKLIIDKLVSKETVRTKYKIYNIGFGKSQSLEHFVDVLEDALNKKAIREYLPMQPGDVEQTYADTSDMKTDFGFAPKISLTEGLNVFAQWYLDYTKRI